MATQHALMNLTMVLEPPHVCNTKKDFYGGKHDLEVDKMHFTSAWMTSPPDPLSAMEQSNSRQPNAERGKEIEKGVRPASPLLKKDNPSPDDVQTAVGEGKKGWGKTHRSHWKQKKHCSEVRYLCQVSTSFGGKPIFFTLIQRNLLLI
jgi:hypothetical protein